MDGLLDPCDIQKLNQDEGNSLKRVYSNSKNKTVIILIKNLSKKKSRKNSLIAKPMLLTPFYLRKERTIPNSLYKPNIRIIWIQKPNKDITNKKERKKKILHQYPWWTYVKEFLTKYLQTKFKKTLKIIIHFDQVRFTPQMQGWFNILTTINGIN